MTKARENFDQHIVQCDEAFEIYSFLEKSGHKADFGLRFVWVAAISALDHYVSELIVEKATEHFSNGPALSRRLLNEGVPLAAVLTLQSAAPAKATLEFRSVVRQAVRFRSFQKAESLADGLSFVWDEDHKWNRLSHVLELPAKSARSKLNSIVYRRDLIAHNADFDEAAGRLRPCLLIDARDAVCFVKALVVAIDTCVP